MQLVDQEQKGFLMKKSLSFANPLFRFTLLLSCLLLPALAAARTWVVPYDRETIAAGLAAAAAGDTVEVATGSYYEFGLEMKSGVTLRSETGQSDCVKLDVQQQGNALSCIFLKEAATIEGFTITGNDGRGDCSSTIYSLFSNLVLSNCVITENTSETRSAGVEIKGGEALIRNCLFLDNKGGESGAIMANNNAVVTVEHCTVVGNSCYTWGTCGNILFESASGKIANSIIAFNTSGHGINTNYYASLEISDTNVYSNWSGNWGLWIIDQVGVRGNLECDPLFCDHTNGELALCGDSPCLPQNNSSAELYGAIDESCGECGAPFLVVKEGPLADAGAGQGVAMIDWDNDLDLDIYIVNDNQLNVLLENDGQGYFEGIAHGILADSGPGRASCWADVDNDGDLDVYLTREGQVNLLARNGGNGNFSTESSTGLEDIDASCGVAWEDVDNDGLVDLYFVDHDRGARLFRNAGYPSGGQLFFLEVDEFASDQISGVSCGWSDLDGLVDVSITNSHTDGFPQNARWLPSSNDAHRDVLRLDYDNDADLDLFIVRSGYDDLLLRNDGNDLFFQYNMATGETDLIANGVAAGDIDGDGDLDIYIVHEDGPNTLLRNESRSTRNWCTISLVGSEANRSGIGARIRLVSDGVSQYREIRAGGGYLSQQPLAAHFGLGSFAAIDTVEIFWPDGDRQYICDLPIDSHHVIEQGRGLLSAGDDPAEREQTLLLGNFPNPFNPLTTVRFELATSTRCRLTVFDLKGRMVRCLLDGWYEPGQHEVVWSGRDSAGSEMPSGTYFCRLETGRYAETLRMVLVR